MSSRLVTQLPPLPPRPDVSHKGTFGHVLIVAGSRGMSGAACLAGGAALRGGAGLTTVAIPEEIASIVAGFEPSYLTLGLPQTDCGQFAVEAGAQILELAGRVTTVACGPGWGTSPGLVELARLLHASVRQPLVVDADGLNALAALPGGCPAAPPGMPRVFTPHPGEFARLLKIDTRVVQENRETLAVEFARRLGGVILLKGRGTVITDGERVAMNSTGNSGMATGGTGDVLTGLIAALLAQDMPPFEAAQLGAHLHGLAGDLAAAELSRHSLIASDLLRYLPHAWKQLDG